MSDAETTEVTEPPRNLLLAGVVGSTAYGMARPGSDVDRLGVYAAPTVQFHGLSLPTGKRATVKRTDVDATYHEAAKYAALALAGNPTVSELLWLPDELYEVRTPLGEQLVGLRGAFASQAIRNTYLGYATQQFRRLTDRGRFPNVPADRVRKHARHLLRLVDQGTAFWVSGELPVRVRDPQRYFDFGEKVAADPDFAVPALARAELTFRRCPTPLAAEPDRAAVERWLYAVRAHYYTPAA